MTTAKGFNWYRWIIPTLLAIVALKPRELVEFKWGKLWTYNIFRFYEMVFGRKFGVRPEMSCSNENGKTVYQAHSFEALLTLGEIAIRGLFKGLKFERLWIPMFSSPNGLPMPALNYLFAIAWDNEVENTGTGTAVQFSYTVTGSNPLIIGFAIDITGSSHDVLTGMKYNNVSLTFMQKQVNADLSNYAYILAGPATGANTFETDSSSSVTWRVRAISYSGCSQSGQPDGSNTGSSTGGSPPQSFSLTTTADNCWLVGCCSGNTNAPKLSSTSPAGGVDRSGGPDTLNISDTNGVVHPAGSATITWTTVSAGSQNWYAILVSIAPSTAVATTAGARLLNLLGVGN